MLSHLKDPVMQTYFKNMLEVESKFEALIPQMSDFIGSIRTMCGVTESVSRLVFEGCGADDSDLGLNVRKYRSTCQKIAVTRLAQLEESSR